MKHTKEKKDKNEKLENCTCENECDCTDHCACECEKHQEPSNEEENRVLFLGGRIKELEDKLIRNQAELQNYKRRKDDEVTRMLKYANEDIILELLPTIDNLERAIKMDDKNLEDEVSKFLEGVKMIYASLVETLKKYEVEKMDCLNKPFNPNYHEAVMTDNNQDIGDEIITEVYQHGYMYKDKVIRPAMVKVNKV